MRYVVDTFVPLVAFASNMTLSGGQTGLAGGADLFPSAVRMVSALAITLGILFSMVYLLRWFSTRKAGSPGSRGLVRVISTTYLGSKQSLVLADVAGEKLVLGLSPQTISLLAKIDRQESLETISAAEKDVQTRKPFVWYLESLMTKRSNKQEHTGVKP
jgi:flagellar protein FliO/FliZ